MSIFFRVSEFFEDSGNNAAIYTEKLRDGVAGFACQLWSSYPSFITQGIAPGTSFARGFLNSMCSPIQPPVIQPVPPFTGGQCIDPYTINTEFLRQPDGGGTPIPTTGIIATSRLGTIVRVTPSLSSDSRTLITTVVYDSGNQLGTFNFGPLGGATVILSSVTYNVTNQVNPADNCGNLPPEYDSPQPSAGDLNTTINININDGLDQEVTIQYVALSNTYNFPMGFQVNGNSVTLDLGGLHFHAPDGFQNPSGGNDLEPPGSQGGEDGEGNPVNKIYNEGDHIVADQSPVLRAVEETIEYLVCNTEAISIIEQTLKIPVGSNAILTRIIDILGNVLEEICGELDPDVGLPEYYGLSPGADRPAIVYIWREYILGKWQRPTYASTVHHPTVDAVDNIPNLTSVEKTIGTVKTFVRLTDGSVIQATGSTELESLANFNFLIDQVKAQYLPVDLPGSTIIQSDDRLSVKTLKLRQIEYYPEGKKDNVPPVIKRRIEP